MRRARGAGAGKMTEAERAVRSRGATANGRCGSGLLGNGAREPGAGSPRRALLASTLLSGIVMATPASLFPLLLGCDIAHADGGAGSAGQPGGGAGGLDALGAASVGGIGGSPTTAGYGAGGGGAGATGGYGGDGNSLWSGGAGGASPGASGENGVAGGAGGGGGAHGFVDTILPSANVQGGNGGNGGKGLDIPGGAPASDGGGGGAGGFGAVLTTSSASLGTLSVNVTGGNGGNGGNSGITTDTSFFYYGGNGGSGGGGLSAGSDNTLTISSEVTGGNGGAGGAALSNSDAATTGGNGGDGVLAPNGLTLVNSGTINGGDGGQGGLSWAAEAGADGVGGVGVRGANMAITTSGAISGGLSGDGVTRADAITFTGGTNTLTLANGWSLNGNLGVNGVGTSLTFKLDGIDADVSNAITGEGSLVVDVGAKVLTLSGTNTYSGNTNIAGGTLSVASEAALGASVRLSMGAPVSGVTDLSGAVSGLDAAIATYAQAPTPGNAAALASAQAAYDTALADGRGAGTLPTLQITGATVFDGSTDGGLFVNPGEAAAIRLEGDGAGLTITNYSGLLIGAVSVAAGGVLDLGQGDGATAGYSFSGNSAANGGIIYNERGTLSLAGATFTGNSATYGGGAILNGGLLTLVDSSFTNNSAGQGGAILSGASLAISRGSFSGNASWRQGGALSLASDSTTVVTDTSFTGNSAGTTGGAVYGSGMDLAVTTSANATSLFSGNLAGGAASSIYLDTNVIEPPHQSPTFRGSTLSVATDSGGLLDMRDPMAGYSQSSTQTIDMSGAGTWALGGSNVFTADATGATGFTVSEGRLYLYGAGEVANPNTNDADAKVAAGTVQLDGADSVFTVGGTATLVAGGANSVTTDGSIRFEDGATLRGGNADTAMGGADPTFMEKGGATSLTLSATGGITLEGTLNVAALGATDSFTLAGALGGEDGALAKSGAGTVILTGASTFAAGTTISTGTLALSGSGALAATGALTLDGATGVFDISDADGARSIGNLSGVAGSAIVLGDNDLAFGGSIATTFAGSFEGTGGLTKAGAGAVAFTGNSAAFTGTTSVTAGHLAVNGTLGGAVEVGTGASLGGTGSIGGLKVGAGGTLGPGNSIGTLTVTGNAVFETGSSFAVEVDAVSADRVSATGSATIEAGAAIDVELDGAYPLGARYMLISSSGLTGRFDTVTGDVGAVSAFFSADLVYDDAAGALYLDVAQARRFADAARTPNQFRTANALNSLPVGNPLFQTVALLPDEASAQAAFTALSGDVNATVRGLFVENSAFARRAMIDRLRAAQGAVGASTAPVMSYAPTGAPAGSAGAAIEAMTLKAAPATTSGPVLWGQGYGAWTDLDGSANAAGLASDTGGFLIGLDTALSSGWRLGVMGGYGYTSFDSGGRDASGSSDDWMVGAYAGRQWGALALRAGLAYAWQDVSSSRTVSLPDLAETLKADYTAGTFQAFGELGYTVETGVAVLEPFANLAYVSLHTGGFGETGGSAALTVASESTDTAFSTLGVRLAREIAFGSLEATLRGTLGWRHAFGDVTPELTQSYFGSAPFTVAGVPIAEDAALVEAGLDLALSPAVTLGIAYAGQFGDGTTQNGLNATIKVAF